MSKKKINEFEAIMLLKDCEDEFKKHNTPPLRKYYLYMLIKKLKELVR